MLELRRCKAVASRLPELWFLQRPDDVRAESNELSQFSGKDRPPLVLQSAAFPL
jgi:hypothetical protein